MGNPSQGLPCFEATRQTKGEPADRRGSLAGKAERRYAGSLLRSTRAICWSRAGLAQVPGGFSSVQPLSRLDSLRPLGLQHTRPPCPSPTPGLYSNSCPSSRRCHPTISSSVIPFSRLQSFPASGSFPTSQFFPSGGQSIRASASASVLPMNTQD